MSEGTGAERGRDEGTVRKMITPMGTCGKKNYMSPEIFANKTNFDGFAVDLWSAVSAPYRNSDRFFSRCPNSTDCYFCNVKLYLSKRV